MSLIVVQSKECPGCGDIKELELDERALERWYRGDLIQRAFPDLHADDRERLATGYCPGCWDQYFSDE